MKLLESAIIATKTSPLDLTILKIAEKLLSTNVYNAKRI